MAYKGSKLLPGTYNLEFQQMFKDLTDSFNNRLDDITCMMNQSLAETKQSLDKLDDNLGVIRDQVKKGNDAIKQEMFAILSAMNKNMEALATKVQDMEIVEEHLQQSVDKIEERLEGYERDLLTIQYKDLEYVIRLRGLKEEKGEDLNLICLNAFSTLLQVDKGLLDGQILKAYRVNSWVAKQKNLSRDVLVYFLNKQLRYDIALAAYHKGFKIQGQEVRVIKEIPKKMLKIRKDFGFLTEELKNRGIQFRWEIPTGVVLYHLGRRYRLTSMDKAQEFYYEVLNAGKITMEGEKPPVKQSETDETAILNGGTTKSGSVKKQKVVLEEKVLEERVTRSKAKKKAQA